MSIFFDMEHVQHDVKKVDIFHNSRRVTMIGTCQNSRNISIHD